MARVYRAEDRELGVQRAIKILSPTKGRRGEHLRARFRTEARAMASLSHPNILSVHDIGTEGDLDYIVMDLAPNGSLMDRLDALDTIPIGLAIQWILEVLSALATAHAAGIVHRDVKPQNVLLSVDDRPLLADFGIAMLADRDLRTTRTGVAMGSMAYMPPEQRVDASKVTHLADIYGVGASLYALLSGQSPVDLFLVDAGSPRWEGIVEPLIPILQRACAASPANRYTSAGEMALALQRFVADVPGIRLELPALSFPDPSPAVYSRTSDPQTPTPRQRRALASNDPLPTRDSSEDAGPTLMPGETPLVEGRPPRWIQAAGVLGILGILGVLGLGILPALIGGPGEDPPTVQPSLASTLPVPTPPAGEAEDGAGVGDGRAGDGRAGDEDGRAGDGRAGDGARAPAPAPVVEAPLGRWVITGTDISPTLFLEGDDDALYGKTVSTLKGKKSEERAIKGRFNRASRELSFEEVNGPYTYRAILDESLCTGDGMVSDGGFRTRVIGMSRRSPTCRPQR